ncbi:hypothetical protein KKG29_02120 [Patescibacteria group bacterium]|nr:hypothetical protein [Patescibacteria group bacterium]MBU4057007.1 hypothetical protein [Patescibacteria group bacterium]MBU4368621.1 hypothetical protein [Patescibacteria group bacterium]
MDIIEICLKNGIRISTVTLALLRKQEEDALSSFKEDTAFYPIRDRDAAFLEARLALACVAIENNGS